MSKEYDERMHDHMPASSAHDTHTDVTQRDMPQGRTPEREMKQQDMGRETSREMMSRDASRMPEQEKEKLQRQEAMRSQPSKHPGAMQGEHLAALFPPDMAQDFRSRWDAIQIGFVDDPRQAVQQADELVEQVMRSLAQTFTRHRASIEAGVRESEQASTENLRMALHHYRSFFQRLLSL